MDDHEIDEIYKIMSNKGVVTVGNMKKFIEAVFFNVEYQHIMQDLPVDDTVTKKEFHRIVRSLVQPPITNHDVFDFWDKGGKGYIDKRDVKALLKGYGLPLEIKDVENATKIFDKEGRMSFERFSKLFPEMDKHSGCK